MADFPRLSGRLYFFPALLPLAELAPWFLGLLGAVTGVAGFTSVLQNHRGKVKLAALLCFIVAGGWWYAAQPDKALQEKGSRLVAKEKLPVPSVMGSVPDGPIPSASTFTQIWTQQTPKQVLSTPVLTKDALMYGSYDGFVEAVARKDGARLWSLPLATYVFSLGEGDGVLYAGTGLHDDQSVTMTVINPADGKVKWQREFLGHIEDEPMIDRKTNRIWLGSGPGGLWVLDAANGDFIWHKPIGHIDSTPLLVGRVAYVPAQAADGKSALHAFNADTGNEIWQSPLPGQPWGTPMLRKSGDAILITSGIGQIGVHKPTDRGWAQALRAADGKMLWQKQLPNMAIQPDLYVPEAGLIIYAINDGQLVALHEQNGEEGWRAKVGTEFQSGAVRLTGEGEPLIAATSYNGIFTIRRTATGEEVLQRTVGKFCSSSPVSADDTVYVPSAWEITAFAGIHSLRSAH